MSVVILPARAPEHPALGGAHKNIVQAGQDLPDNVLRLTMVNLMDKPVGYDIKFIRLIAASLLPQDRPVLLQFWRPSSIDHAPEDADYLARFYAQDCPQGDRYIISGRIPHNPVLSDEPYYTRLTALFDQIEQSRTPTIAFCLAAHIGLLHRHGIPRKKLPEKLFGVYPQHIVAPKAAFVAGLGEAQFDMPVSRYYYSDEAGIVGAQALQVVSTAAETGASIVQDGPITYITGHPEYDALTLKHEYDRDSADDPCAAPYNYNLDQPLNTWDAASRQMIRNFLSPAMEEEALS